MTAPPRWSTEHGRAPVSVRHLLAAAAHPRDPLPSECAAMAHKATQLVAGVPMGVWGGGLVKAVLTTVVLVAFAVGARWAVHRQHARVPPSVAAQSRAVLATVSPTVVSPVAQPSPQPVLAQTDETHGTPVVVRQARAVPLARVRAVAPPVSSAVAVSRELAPMDELGGLLAARSLLHTDDAAALALLRAHERAFPGSQFGPERSFMEVRALVALGRIAEARAVGASLVDGEPEGPFAQRTRELVGGHSAESIPDDSPMRPSRDPQ